MTHTEHRYAVALAAVMLLCGLHPCDPVHAQAPDIGLMLAKVMVNEAHFDAPDDHLAIANYTRRVARARGMTMAVFLPHRYRRALAPASERRGRPWIAGLNRAGTEPEHWPGDRVRWDDYRDRWLTTLDRADAFLRGEIDAPPMCRPHGWGSPVFDRDELDEHYRRGCVRVACGAGTRNEFYECRGAR